MHFLHRMSETNGQWVFFNFPIWEPGHNVVLVESVKSKRVTIFRKCKPKDLKCNAKYTFLLFYFGYILKGKKDELSGSMDCVREKEKFYAGSAGKFARTKEGRWKGQSGRGELIHSI